MDAPVQLNEHPTNGVVYMRLLADASCIPEEARAFLPLFCALVGQVGAAELDCEELSCAIERVTGGISASVQLAAKPEEPTEYSLGVLLSTHFLARNLPAAAQLLAKVSSVILVPIVRRTRSSPLASTRISGRRTAPCPPFLLLLTASAWVYPRS